MYTINNLTHRSVKLSDTVSVKPKGSVKYPGPLTPHINKLKELDIITISNCQARSVNTPSKKAAEDFAQQVANLEAARIAAYEASQPKSGGRGAAKKSS